MASTNRYRPIGSTGTYRVRSLLTLPFELEKAIGIDIVNINRLLQIGGIKRLTIINDPDGKIERAVPLILGVDKNGAAFAGAAKNTTAPTTNSESSHKNYSGYSSLRWVNATIKINTEQIKSDILRDNKKVNSPEIWAETLNSIVVKEILFLGVSNLLKRTISDKIHMLVVLSMIIQNVVAWHKDLTWLALGSLITFSISLITWNIVMLIIFGNEQPGDGHRFTVFTTFPELDRMIFLYMLTRNTTLIKKFDIERRTNELHQKGI